MICNEIIEILEKMSPVSCAFSWDNVGLMVGDRDAQVRRVLIALDADDAAVQKAVDIGADMMITHHPLIFGGIQTVTADTFTGRRIMKMIQNKISCYAMHTNFDVTEMEQLAADMLGLEHAEKLISDENEEVGKIADVQGCLTLKEWADKIKEVFGLPAVLVFGDENISVNRVAVAPGSGKDSVIPAAKLGADLVITGDIGHHTGTDANAMGLSVIDAGHYGIEHIFIDYIREYLEKNLRNVEVVSMDKKLPFKVM